MTGFVPLLAAVSGPVVAVMGFTGLIIGLRRYGVRPLAVPITLLVAGTVTFAAAGLAGLSIIPRYLTLPAVALSVFAGHFVVSVARASTADHRRAIGLFAGLAAVAIFLVGQLSAIKQLREELDVGRDAHDELAKLLAEPGVRQGLRCGAITFPTHRLVADARWLLDDGVGAVRTRAEGGAGGGVDVYVVGGGRFQALFGRADGVRRSTNRAPNRDPTVVHRRFVAYADCEPGPSTSR